MTGTLTLFRQELNECRRCPIGAQATQGVPGRGPAHAKVVLIGEQPGDQEDRQGEPFVGPAGRLLDQALERAGVERSHLYVTNVVKHFKWEARGKRRIHKTPAQSEIDVCIDWLAAEMAELRPRVIVCLGGTAAKALFGNDFRVTRERGQLRAHAWAPTAFATVHPSSILRTLDADSRARELDGLVADLALIPSALR